MSEISSKWSWIFFSKRVGNSFVGFFFITPLKIFNRNSWLIKKALENDDLKSYCLDNTITRISWWSLRLMNWSWLAFEVAGWLPRVQIEISWIISRLQIMNDSLYYRDRNQNPLTEQFLNTHWIKKIF